MLKIFVLGAVAALASSFSHAGDVHLRLAVTTSTENSGLLDYLMPLFEEETGISVDTIATGTGKALKLGEKGDVDVVLVHAPAAEEAFVAAGFGINRRAVMYNDFLVVGPRNDPAGLMGLKSAEEAFVVLRHGEFPFVSRGDDSGTHRKEKELWESAGVKPSGRWYLETGQGMATTLRVADEKRAYCLVDRATYLALRRKIVLEVCFEGGQELLNSYGVIAVNPGRHRHVKYREAMRLIEWMTSPAGQKSISEFKIEGKRVFHPVALASRSITLVQ